MDPTSKQDKFALDLVPDQHRAKDKINRNSPTDEGRPLLALVEKKESVERPEHLQHQKEVLMQLPGSAASVEDLQDILQKGAGRVIKEARIERLQRGGTKNRLEKYRVGKKQKLPHRRLLRGIEESQDAEPMHVSSLNALPHFGYLEIAEQEETELPSELAGFGSLDLSKVENPEAINEIVRREAAEMPRRLSLPLDSDAEDLASSVEYLLPEPSSKEFFQPGHPCSTSEVQDPGPSLHSAYKTQRYPTDIPRDNLLCIFVTCPIREMHYEGPYHHKGELGDQDHPYFKGSNPPPFVWRAYEKRKNGTSTHEEDEIVGGFWAWHVPPFSCLPEEGLSDTALEEQDIEMEDLAWSEVADLERGYSPAIRNECGAGGLCFL